MSWNDIEYDSDDIQSVTQSASYSDESIDENLQAILSTSNEVMESATVRLAKGRLYEMLLKHDIFDDTLGEDPRAIRQVQDEVRAFVTERLEIMLGMKTKAVRKEIVPEVSIEFPFDDLEIAALKALADNLNKGAKGDKVVIQADVSLSGQEVEVQVKRPEPKRPLQTPFKIKKKTPIKRVEQKQEEQEESFSEEDKTAKTSAEDYKRYVKNRKPAKIKVGTSSSVRPMPMPDENMMNAIAASQADANLRGGNATLGSMGGSMIGANAVTNALVNRVLPRGGR